METRKGKLRGVTYGDPNNEYLPKWEKVRKGETWTMLIDRDCRCVCNHDEELMELYHPVAPQFSL